MSDWWARKLAGDRPSPAPQTGGAWWQEPARPSPALQQQMPYQGATGPQGVPEDQYMRQLAKLPADQLDAGQMEALAEWELRTKGKYNETCPQCGSTNYVPAGSKVGGTVFPTERCFECGLSARGPEPALGGTSRSGNVATQTVRQIDTGGGAGSMYMRFDGMPRAYVPRSS